MYKNEFEIITNYFAAPNLSFDHEGIDLGIGDDAALIRIPSATNLSISTDVLVEGVHFPINAGAAQIAKRALLVNLSDLAAMAAKPYCFTLGLILPNATENWLCEFSKGLGEIAQEFGISLIGGDLSEGPMAVAIQVHGITPVNKSLRRNGAKIGDQIFVTGSLGEGAIGLLCAGGKSHLGPSFKFMSRPSEKARDYFEKAYFQPTPRVDFALNCRDYISSAIDISDGLIGDLQHLIKASGTGAVIDIEKIPVSNCVDGFLSSENLLRAALFGGDDYELCVSVAPEKCEDFVEVAGRSDTRVTLIGEIIAGDDVEFMSSVEGGIDADGKAYTHFSPERR